MSETKREYGANHRKPPLHTRFRKAKSGDPRGRPNKNLPGIGQLVNEAASANLRATKMLIDMMKDIEKKTSVEPPPEHTEEIQDINAGNPALAMISLPLS